MEGKFQKRGHLRTFQDIQAWHLTCEGPSMSRFGAESLLIGVVSVINHQVSSLALLDLPTSDGTLSKTSDSNMVERCFLNWQAQSVSAHALLG